MGKKLKQAFHKRRYPIGNKHMKGFCTFGKCKFKPKWDTTEYPLDWLKILNRPYKAVAKMWNDYNSHALPTGVEISASTLDQQFYS